MTQRHISDRELAIFRNNHGENVPVPAPDRKSLRTEESRLQCALIKWWSGACLAFNVPEIMLFAIPNGGWRGPRTGAIMKREGVRSGVTDLFLAVKRGEFGGLWIEMKTPDGVISSSQHIFMAEATRQGYAAYACYNVEEARTLISDYLSNRPLF